MDLEPPTLTGRLVRLRPLEPADVDALVAAATEDRRSYGHTSVPGDRPTMTDYVGRLLGDVEAGRALHLVTVSVAEDRVLGATRFSNFRHWFDRGAPDAVEIGATWLAASAQRTGVNTEVKLLQLGHAFEVWGAARVDFVTDARNERSRAALEGIGATFEGVLHSWQPSFAPGEAGLVRDSAMFSIVAASWPAVRERLRSRLAS